jgi:drug/metabolite transporter (DMT)-like permease
MKPFLLTSAAMLAFAGNTIFCRWALGRELIDPASFTGIRLLSGAVMLLIILRSKPSPLGKPRFDYFAIAMLFLYAITFSYAYIDLATGTGALILFGFVQLTMIIYGLANGDRPAPSAWTGMALAVAGLVYLLLPGVSSPPPLAALLMACAGIAWGFYSLRGRLGNNPIASTTWNFVGTLPLAVIAVLSSIRHIHIEMAGIGLAILSGAIASGVGYAIWYSALPYLTPMRAANVQLSVPVIAALGGVVAMNEAITLRLVIASALTLGGIAIVITARQSR